MNVVLLVGTVACAFLGGFLIAVAMGFEAIDRISAHHRDRLGSK